MALAPELTPDAPSSFVGEPRRWLVVLVSGGFFLVLAYVLIQYVRVHWDDVLVLGVAAVALLGATAAADRLLGGRDWLERHGRVVFIGALLAVFALQALYVREIYTTHGWDPRSVFAAAIDLAHFKQSAVASHTPEVYTSPGLSIPYWSSYPNNLLLAFVYEVVFRVCAALGVSSVVYVVTCLNVLVLDVAIVLAVMCAGPLWGRGAQRVTFLVALPFLAFSPWVSVAYSDTIATLFPVLLLYLYIRYLTASQRGQYFLAASMGAVSAIGYLVKPHVLAMTLAIVLVHAFATTGSPWIAKVSKLGVAVLVALLVVTAFGTYRDFRLRDRIPRAQLEASRFPISHFIAMSLNDETGGYNPQDVEAQRALIGTAAKNERNIRVIRQRLQEMGPAGYAAFLHRKLTWITSDGTFFWQGEGRLSDYVPFHDGAFARKIQSVVFRSGKHYRWFALAANAAWLAVLLAMVAPAATPRRFDAGRVLLAARLAPVILVLMLLVLEGRSRYLISFAPVFVLLGSQFLSGVWAEDRLRRGDAANDLR